MNISLYSLNKNQSNVLKAVAILCIVMHNYLHMTNSIGENEMQFDPNRIFNLFQWMVSVPTISINALFTYFGFFTVYIFVFLSGYGLTKKFMQDDTVSYQKYIVPRLVKIYSLLIFGIVIYLLLFFNRLTLDWFLEFAISSLLLINNFSYDRCFSFVGPWWYFALTIQFYFVFPFLYRILKRYKMKGFIALFILSYVLIYLLYPITERFNFPLFANLPGHLPIFLFGMAIAMFKEITLNWKIVLPAAIVFISSNFSAAFYPLGFLSATILLLCACYPLINLSDKSIWIKVLLFVGNMSMIMFVFNGPLRTYTMPLFSGSPLYIFLGSTVHLCVVIVFSYIMYLIYKLIAKLVRKLFDISIL